MATVGLGFRGGMLAFYVDFFNSWVVKVGTAPILVVVQVSGLVLALNPVLTLVLIRILVQTKVKVHPLALNSNVLLNVMQEPVQILSLLQAS